MSLCGLKAALLRDIDIDLPPGALEALVSKHGAQPWFLYAHAKRGERPHVWWPSLWLAARLSTGARILETGCGCGLNLLWFAQQGFNSLYGCDVDAKAIAVGIDLFAEACLPATLWIEDGFSPAWPQPHSFDAILALNWTYHSERFDLLEFLELYRKHIARAGYLVMDFIDSAYDSVPNNQFLTSDWVKPVEARAPTEYKIRYSEKEVRAIAKSAGFYIRASKTLTLNGVPRCIAILSSNN